MERGFRVHRRDGTHWIPIVQKRPCRRSASVAFPHDPTPVTATGGIPFPEWEEPTDEDKRKVAKMCDAAKEDTRFSNLQRPQPEETRNADERKRKNVNDPEPLLQHHPLRCSLQKWRPY